MFAFDVHRAQARGGIVRELIKTLLAGRISRDGADMLVQRPDALTHGLGREERAE